MQLKMFAVIFMFALIGCTKQATVIRNVSCVGATELTEGHVYEWLQENLSDSLMDVDLVKLRRDLLATIPLKNVDIERQWPDRLVFHIQERTPYAMVLDDAGSISLVNRSGQLASLRQDQRIALWDRPAIRGCARSSVIDAPNLCIRRALSFMTWIDHQHPEWLTELSEIQVNTQNVTAWMDNGIAVRFSDGPMAEQLDALAYAWPIAQKNNLNIHGISIVGSDRVIFKTTQNPKESGA